MDLHDLQSRCEEAKRLLIKNALLCAQEEFNDDPGDPGWQAELNDEEFEKSALVFVRWSVELAKAKTSGA